MKKYINILILGSLLAAFTACHEPEYYVPEDEEGTEVDNGLGIVSLTAIFPTGSEYADKELAVLNVTDPEATVFDIPVPYYYPETSDNSSLFYLTNLRVRAKLNANWKLAPKTSKVSLNKIDLTEQNEFVLTGPDGKSRDIIITGHQAKLTGCSIISFMVTDLGTSGIVKEADKEVMIPYLQDLSGVKFTAQLSPHAKILKVGNKTYNENNAYDLNEGQIITIQAHDENVTAEYKITQDVPKPLDYGLNKASLSELFAIDPVASLGFPDYSTLCYPSIAAFDQNLVVCFGNGTEPVLLNKFNGTKTGTMNIGSAVADAITNDDAGHVLICNAAGSDEEVHIYVSSDAKSAPVALGSFVNPLDIGSGYEIGHRMKVYGNVAEEAVIVFTSEGIPTVTSASRAVWVKVAANQLSGEPQIVDFAANTLGWGGAPVEYATVIPASLNPDQDGFYVSYYGDNADPVAAENGEDCYILHHIDKKGKDTQLDLLGTWADNPNCLDIKKFNGSDYMVWMSVSHFPSWGGCAKLNFYEATTPGSLSKVLPETKEMKVYQSGAYNDTVGACGDICLSPTSDGYYLFLYYYDHHTHTLGGFKADCFKL